MSRMWDVGTQDAPSAISWLAGRRPGTAVF